MSKPKLPRSVKISALTFTIHTDMHSVREMTAHDADTETIGETHLAVLKITIDPKVPLSKRRDTLLHEILHALVFTVGGWDKKQTEEEWIARSSTVLLGILRDNPEIVAYLTAED